VVVVNSKSTFCPVCPVLLQKLSFLSGNSVPDPSLSEEIHVPQFIDPFTFRVTNLPSAEEQDINRLVLFCDAAPIVLCPGETAAVARVAMMAGETWKNIPFVADAPELPLIMQLARYQPMRLSHGQAIPAILDYDGIALIIDFGRRCFLLSIIMRP
jgi:hypothetical protein